MRKECFGCKSHKDKIGVLIAQLGTPDAPTPRALRPYLRKFLGDPRVIEKPRWFWLPLLYGVILTTRPKRSARLYSRIWTAEGSPLLVFTKKVSRLLQETLKTLHPSIEVAFGMRYSDPSIEVAIDDLIERGCSKILMFNMYPQYSATTTATNYDAAFKHLLKRRVVPTLRVAEPYFAHPEYIKSLAAIINEYLRQTPQRPEKLVLSYHGIPEEYIDKGDTYCCQCTETTQALLPLLAIKPEDVIHTYQSRFGRDPWLEPYTDETIERLAKQGTKHIAIFAPGFTADCLETLDELGNEGRELFEEHGGVKYDLLPCLNDSKTWIEAIENIIAEELYSWLNTARRSSAANQKVACPVKLHKKAA